MQNQICEYGSKQSKKSNNYFYINIKSININQKMSSRQSQQSYHYFLIDRKLTSSKLSQLLQALDEIVIFLNDDIQIDVVNSIVMRLLEMLQSVTHFRVKFRIRDILEGGCRKVVKMHNWEEVVNVVGRCVRGFDEVTRIVSLQIMRSLAPLFSKDVSLYHSLLEKLSPTSNTTKVQQKQSIISLSTMLNESSYISQLFATRFPQISQSYGIKTEIILYLLNYTQIQPNEMILVLNRCRSMIQEDGRIKGKARKYFSGLVLKFVWRNYRVVTYFWVRFEKGFEGLGRQIGVVVEMKFPFLKKKVSNSHSYGLLTCQNLLDFLYNQKANKKSLEDYQQHITQQLDTIISQTITPHNIYQAILLTYYLQNSHIKQNYDKIVKKILEQQYISSNINWRKILKMVLCVGLTETAAMVLEIYGQLIVEGWVLVILVRYVEFLVDGGEDSLGGLVEVCRVFQGKVYGLVCCWAAVASKQPLHPSGLSSLISSICFPQDKQLLTTIIKHSSSLSQLVRECQPYLPSFQQVNKYWFAKFSKEVILYLCH